LKLLINKYNPIIIGKTNEINYNIMTSWSIMFYNINFYQPLLKRHLNEILFLTHFITTCSRIKTFTILYSTVKVAKVYSTRTKVGLQYMWPETKCCFTFFFFKEKQYHFSIWKNVDPLTIYFQLIIIFFVCLIHIVMRFFFQLFWLSTKCQV
jgi:hypothetical protein